MGRATGGVIGMKLRAEDEVIAALIADDNADLLVVTENGYGKRTRISEYPRKGRGTMGVKTVQLTEARGQLAGAQVVRDGYQVMLMSTGGQVIRMPTDGHPPRRPGDAGRDRDAAARGGRESVEPRAGRRGGRAGRRRRGRRGAPPRRGRRRRRAGSRRRELAAAQARCRLFGRQRIHVDARRRARCRPPLSGAGTGARCHQGPSWSQRFSGHRSAFDRRGVAVRAPRPVRSAAARRSLANAPSSRGSARRGARRARPTLRGRWRLTPRLLEDELAVEHAFAGLGGDGRRRLAKPHELRVRVRRGLRRRIGPR